MTIRPIIFSAPMVRALLEGRKTQTRRILKPKRGSTIRDLVAGALLKSGIAKWLHLPLDRLHHPYAIGDLLYVREAHEIESNHVVFAATDEGPQVRKFKPSIHMPRWASRLTLEVTGVRVQRLNEISDEDAVCEGCQVEQVPGREDLKWNCPTTGVYQAPSLWFKKLWNTLHGPDSWDQNPWVVAITFTVHKCNVDSLTSWDRLRGVAPDATGNLPSEAFVRAQREEWDR